MDGGVYVAQCRLEGQLHGHLAKCAGEGVKGDQGTSPCSGCIFMNSMDFIVVFDR